MLLESTTAAPGGVPGRLGAHGGAGPDPGKVSDPGLAGFAGASAASGHWGRIFRTTRKALPLGGQLH